MFDGAHLGGRFTRMRRGQINPRSWDAAIRAVQKHLLEFSDHVPVTTDQGRILGAVYGLCDQLTARRYLAWVPTNRELAAKYRISPRTVTNWRREGCPFSEGQTRVLGWIARRRYAPVGAKAKFEKQLGGLKFDVLMEECRAAVANARQLKLACKLNGIKLAPDDWLRGFRCPRR